MMIFCKKKNKYLKILQVNISENALKSTIFLVWQDQIFLIIWKANLCLKREDRLLLTQN